MNSGLLRELQDEYDELNRRAGFGPQAQERVNDAMKLVLDRHALTEEEFAHAIVKQLEASYPQVVTLRFRTVEDKTKFMTHLSCEELGDYCDLSWPYEAGVKLEDSLTVGVDLIQYEGYDGR